MIARLMRGLWVAVLVAAALAAWWCIHLFGSRIGTWASGLLGVFVVFAAHPGIVAFNFTLSRMHGDPVPERLRQSLWQTVRMIDAEVDASMRGVWFGTPFLPHRPAPRPPADMPPRPLPVLFIHGYLCNRAVWLSFMRDAAASGYLCEAVTLPDPFADIDTQLPVIDRAIDALLTEARSAGIDAPRVALVGHSMGGLVARAATARLDGSRIGPLITLGTPHHGTYPAGFGTSPSVVQMRRGSAWLAALPSTTTRHAVTTIFSHHDNIVYPQTTAALEGTRQMAIGGVGHLCVSGVSLFGAGRLAFRLRFFNNRVWQRIQKVLHGIACR